MSDNGANKAKAESFFKKKEGSVFPKEKKSVMKMMGEAEGKAVSSYIDKTKNIKRPILVMRLGNIDNDSGIIIFANFQRSIGPLI